MKEYSNVKSSDRPSEIKMTDVAVFVASDIQPYTQIIDDVTVNGYIYTLTEYTKDEYILLLAQKSQELEDELAATKVILGVE